jgi:hypothetical protein
MCEVRFSQMRFTTDGSNRIDPSRIAALKINCPASSPRQQVMYIIRSMADRLQKSTGWLVSICPTDELSLVE